MPSVAEELSYASRRRNLEADASAAETARFRKEQAEAAEAAREFALEAFHRADMAAQRARYEAELAAEAAENPPRTPSPSRYDNDVPWSSEKPPT